MKKLRIVKKSWPSGRECFEIQVCGWFNRWKPAKQYYYALGCRLRLSQEIEYDSLEEAQKNLWRFDGTKYPKVEVVQYTNTKQTLV